MVLDIQQLHRARELQQAQTMRAKPTTVRGASSSPSYMKKEKCGKGERKAQTT
jgi:hypothetical protein